jgi:probable O-glycosylation ligase (exosortase A-associated)
MDKELVFGVAVLVAVVASLPICFRWPWAGAVLWGWLAFLYPSRLYEGRAFGLHLIWLVAAVVLAGVAVNGVVHRLPRSRELYLLLAFWAFTGVTTAASSIFPERAWAYFGQWTWNLAVVLLVMVLSLDRRRLAALLWATALPLGLYALAGTVWLAYTGGTQQLYGPRSSDVWGNNNLGATLAAIAPFFVFLGRHASPWAARAAYVLFAVTVVALLGTYSRGAALALVLVLASLAAYGQWRALALLALGFAVFMAVTTPATWLARIDTLCAPDQEASASMRRDEWYVAWRLGLDHPLLGAGFLPFSAEAYRRYVPGSTDHRDAHNVFPRCSPSTVSPASRSTPP